MPHSKYLSYLSNNPCYKRGIDVHFVFLWGLLWHFVVIPTDDLTTVAEPGAARGLPAPDRDCVGAASTGHATLQQSGDSRSGSTGAVKQTHLDDSADGESAGQSSAGCPLVLF